MAGNPGGQAIRIQTFSVICGTSACDARCPYCVSKMTPRQGVDAELRDPNWRNFGIANAFARDCGVSTVLLTGKGEPTLYPTQISAFLRGTYNVPFRASDSFLLAHLTEEDGASLDDQQRQLIDQFKRGKGYRFCLTPYFEDQERASQHTSDG